MSMTLIDYLEVLSSVSSSLSRFKW